MNNLAHRMTNKLETDVRELSRILYDARVSYLFKVPEEMTQTPVDFFGFTPSGRAVLLECKQVNRKSLPIGVSNGIMAHQWNALELADRCGAISLLVWRRGEATAVFTFRMMQALSRGRKSIEWPTIVHHDWRGVIRAFLGPESEQSGEQQHQPQNYRNGDSVA